MPPPTSGRRQLYRHQLGRRQPGAPQGNHARRVRERLRRNTIGGSPRRLGNTIGFNAIGIRLDASDVLVMGNDIGTDLAHDDLGNTIAGIVVNGVSDDTIGGTAAAAANLIGFNTYRDLDYRYTELDQRVDCEQ